MKDNLHKLHKYQRVRNHPKGRRDLFMCMDPHCKHRINAIWLDGRAAECYYCGEEFIITKKKLQKQGYLHCDNCRRGGKPPSLLNLEDLTNRLGEIL